MHKKGFPYTLEIKNYTSDESIIVSLDKGFDISKLKLEQLNCLYPNGRKISKVKYLDLQKLASLIPIEYRDYFKNISYDDESDNDSSSDEESVYHGKR